MKIKFTKDFARNWEAGEIVEVKYLGMGEMLVDNVAKVDTKQLLKHCKIVNDADYRTPTIINTKNEE